MATQSENADIAVLQTEMRTVKDATLRIETKLDAYNSIFVDTVTGIKAVCTYL